MFLQVMSLSWYVCLDGLACAQLDPSEFPLGGIWLFGWRDDELGDDTLPLWGAVQEGCAGHIDLPRFFTTHGLVESHCRCG